MTHNINNITKALCCIITALLLAGCIEEYNAELPTGETNLVVVEGTIISDSLCTFYISRTKPVNYEGNDYNISGAKIVLKGTDDTSVNGYQTAPGVYAVPVPVLNANKEYYIEVTVDGDTYASSPLAPLPSTPIETIEGKQWSYNSNIDVLITTDVPEHQDEIQYYRWTYDETWELRPEIFSETDWDPVLKKGVQVVGLYPQRGWREAHSSDIIASSSAYYGNNQIAGYKLYDIDYSDKRLWYLYSVCVHQRSMRKAEYEYENERHRVSTEMGGLFTPQPSTLPTNIQCVTSSKRVLGYVGCSLNVSHKRVFFHSSDFYILHDAGCREITPEDDTFLGNEKMYESGYKLVMFIDNMISWTTSGCVDIRGAKVSLDKPSYWPE